MFHFFYKVVSLFHFCGGGDDGLVKVTPASLTLSRGGFWKGFCNTCVNSPSSVNNVNSLWVRVEVKRSSNKPRGIVCCRTCSIRIDDESRFTFEQGCCIELEEWVPKQVNVINVDWYWLFEYTWLMETTDSVSIAEGNVLRQAWFWNVDVPP